MYNVQLDLKRVDVSPISVTETPQNLNLRDSPVWFNGSTVSEVFGMLVL